MSRSCNEFSQALITNLYCFVYGQGVRGVVPIKERLPKKISQLSAKRPRAKSLSITYGYMYVVSLKRYGGEKRTAQLFIQLQVIKALSVTFVYSVVEITRYRSKKSNRSDL